MAVARTLNRRQPTYAFDYCEQSRSGFLRRSRFEQRGAVQRRAYEATLTIAEIARLAGDSVQTSAAGPVAVLLLAEARAGRLRVIGHVDRFSDGRPKRDPYSTLVHYMALREWLQSSGTGELRASAAAAWANASLG